MVIAEKISRCVEELPEHPQEEALDFIEYLLMKAKANPAQQEDEIWSSLSLTSAMRGMENEDTPSVIRIGRLAAVDGHFLIVAMDRNILA